MATDWGSVGAGFVKGFADDQLRQIDMQREEDSAMRKAKLLEDLRASTEERLATFRDKLTASRTSNELSGPEGDEYIYRDADGNEKSRRALTSAEKEARDRARRKDDLDNSKSEASIRASDASIRQGDERNALTRRGQDMDQAYRMQSLAQRAQSEATGSTGSGTPTATEIGNRLVSINQAAVDQAMKDDKVPREQIDRMAAVLAANLLARGITNPESVNDAFRRALNDLRSGAEGSGNDVRWSLETFNSNRNKQK